MNNEPRNTRTYTINQTAWLLGISPSRVSRDIRTGAIRTERKAGRIVVAEREIMRLLDGTQDGHVIDRSPAWVAGWVSDLDHFRYVPTEVLYGIVTDGCAPWGPESEPEGATDAQLATEICKRCTAPVECVELELRLHGDHTIGVWGGLAEDDRRLVHRAWIVDRDDTSTVRGHEGEK